MRDVTFEWSPGSWAGFGHEEKVAAALTSRSQCECARGQERSRREWRTVRMNHWVSGEEFREIKLEKNVRDNCIIFIDRLQNLVYNKKVIGNYWGLFKKELFSLKWILIYRRVSKIIERVLRIFQCHLSFHV